MNEPTRIPEWMRTEENYIPPKDSDRFLNKTLLGMMGVLAKARTTVRPGKLQGSAPIALFTVLVLIVLTACAKNMFFTYCMLAVALIGLCLLPGKQLKGALSATLGAVLLSFFILLPAALLGSPRTLITICIKVFISVSLIGILNSTIPWNQITKGLRFYHVPSIFIFTLDITLKFIVLLGEVAQNMLEALKMRSIGKNPKKKDSFSGIMGVTFLKSRELSDQVFDAMTCRGFDGEYEVVGKPKLKKADLLYGGVLLLSLVSFIFLERGM